MLQSARAGVSGVGSNLAGATGFRATVGAEWHVDERPLPPVAVVAAEVVAASQDALHQARGGPVPQVDLQKALVSQTDQPDSNDSTQGERHDEDALSGSSELMRNKMKRTCAIVNQGSERLLTHERGCAGSDPKFVTDRIWDASVGWASSMA